MTIVKVIGVGLLGPALPDWATTQTLLREPAAWQRQATVIPAPNRLPAAERRRAGNVIKASIAVADEALAACGLQASELPTVFTSSTGDPLNCHLLCEALATTERMVSPTRFTNSVHNAAAGYWHIAAQSRQPSTSLAAFDASFAAGLLEAAVQVQATQAPVMLVACDVPYPEPLHALRPVDDVMAVALVLAPESSSSGRALRIETASGDAPTTRCVDAAFEALRLGIPAARALPLLCALTSDAATSVMLEGPPGSALAIHVAR
jgi:Beta-ketoacyl synthase, N-terminal domain